MEGTRTDAELGAVRWCGRCEEWWPDDREFFYYQIRLGSAVRRTTITQITCKACQRERNARAYARRPNELRLAYYYANRDSLLAKRRERAVRGRAAA